MDHCVSNGDTEKAFQKPSQASEMELYAKIILRVKSHRLFSQKVTYSMFDWVLNTPVNV